MDMYTRFTALSFALLSLCGTQAFAATGPSAAARLNLAAGLCSQKMKVTNGKPDLCKDKKGQAYKDCMDEYDDCMATETPRVKALSATDFYRELKKLKASSVPSVVVVAPKTVPINKQDTTQTSAADANRAQTYCWGADDLKKCMDGQLVTIRALHEACKSEKGKSELENCVDDRLNITNYCASCSETCSTEQNTLIQQARAKCPNPVPGAKKDTSCFRKELAELRHGSRACAKPSKDSDPTKILEQISKPLTNPACQTCH